MISLAMVLLLILGINYVFRSATDAVGAGQTMNGINADAQSAQPVLFNDLNDVAKNPPCFIISSQLVNQYINADDAKTSTSPNTIITDNSGGQNASSNIIIGNGTSTPLVTYLSPALLNSRSHRADMLKFFAHALYHRRSGPDGTFYATDSSNDAFIELGHAALPANDFSAFYGPSSLPISASQLSINNLPGVPRLGAYASDWVLARRVTLLKDPTAISGSPPTGNNYFYPPPTATAPLQYAPQGTTPAAFAVPMGPLSYGTPDNNPSDNPPTPGVPVPINQFQSSRYDLAGVTPDQFDRTIANAILGWQTAGYAGTSLWWNPLVYTFQMTQLPKFNPTYPWDVPSLTSFSVRPPYPPYYSYYYSAAPDYRTSPPFTTVAGLAPTPTPSTSPPNTLDTGLWYNRPQCNPTIQTPVSAASLAQMAPYFLQHCSQFIVEYAGDYMQQVNRQYLSAPPNPPNTPNPNYGAMTALGSDGQIDYYVDANGNKHIRWYGMPRSSTGALHPSDGTATATQVLIRGYDPSTSNDDPRVANVLNYFTDVIPLRDYYSMAANFIYGNAIPNPRLFAPPWEPDVNFVPTKDYASPNLAALYNPYYDKNGGGSPNGALYAFNDPANPPRYVAAWHDDMPAMIRILIKVDDPNNKVKDGPWYEYIFRLK